MFIFYVCLDPDPKQIISNPEPGKSCGSNSIRIRNTGLKLQIFTKQPANFPSLMEYVARQGHSSIDVWRQGVP